MKLSDKYTIRVFKDGYNRAIEDAAKFIDNNYVSSKKDYLATAIRKLKKEDNHAS